MERIPLRKHQPDAWMKDLGRPSSSIRRIGKGQNDSGRYIFNPKPHQSPLTPIFPLQPTIRNAYAEIANSPQRAQANLFGGWSGNTGVSGDCCSVGSQTYRPLSSRPFQCGELEMAAGPSLPFMLLDSALIPPVPPLPSRPTHPPTPLSN